MDPQAHLGALLRHVLTQQERDLRQWQVGGRRSQLIQGPLLR